MSQEKFNHEERFATSTSYHGMAHIYDGQTSKQTRSFWLVLTLIATGACISQCVIIILNASQLPTRIVTKTVLQNSSIFPSVTICNTNDYDRNSLSSSDIQHLSTIVDFVYGYDIEPHRFEAAISNLSIKFGKGFNYELFLRRAGHKLENMLLSCTWMGRPCSIEDFVNTTTAAGSCFTFNPGKYHIKNDNNSKIQ